MPTNGQFGDNQWNNPQMKPNKGGATPAGNPMQRGNQAGGGWADQYAAGNQPWGGFGGGGEDPEAGQGWGNQNSSDYQWQGNWRPDQAAWQGGTPGHQGQTLSYNPQTGEQEWVTDPSGLSFGQGAGHQSGGMGRVSWIDPQTGQRMVDPNAIQNMFGGQGQGGNQGYQNYQGSSYSGGDVTPGAGYGGYDYQQSSIDPSAVIAAQEYKLQESMEGDMARAGGRAGQSGFAMSTPYANQLGEAARKASQDRNALTMQYQYDAAQAQAGREQQQQMQAAQSDFGGWQTGYQGDLQSQMFNEGQNFQGWLAGEQMGMQNNQGQNAWNMQQNQLNANQNQQGMNQQLMAQLMGGLF